MRSSSASQVDRPTVTKQRGQVESIVPSLFMRCGNSKWTKLFETMLWGPRKLNVRNYRVTPFLSRSNWKIPRKQCLKECRHCAISQNCSTQPFVQKQEINRGPESSQHAKRPGANRPMGCCVEPAVARSARISPITGANLNPCPEKPHATVQDGTRGCGPMTKCSSGVMV